MGEWKKPLETNPTIPPNSKNEEKKNEGMGETIGDQSVFAPFFPTKNGKKMGKKHYYSWRWSKLANFWWSSTGMQSSVGAKVWELGFGQVAAV